MKKNPTEIKRGKGVIKDESIFYSGFALTLLTIYGELILTASNIENLKAQAVKIMPPTFIVDESLIQGVSIFSSKKVQITKRTEK